MFVITITEETFIFSEFPEAEILKKNFCEQKLTKTCVVILVNFYECFLYF